jgi:hypothetical protein
MIALFILCCLSLAVVAAVAYFDWKRRKEEEEEAENKRFLSQKVPSGDESVSQVPASDCQNTSDNNLTWPGHRGLAELEKWGSFNFDNCATYPSAYTSTPLFAQIYQKIGSGSPKDDPALTEDQQIDDTGTNIIRNVISKKKLELATNGVLSLKTDAGEVPWRTPAGSGSEFKLKFDQNVNNNGNNS